MNFKLGAECLTEFVHSLADFLVYQIKQKWSNGQFLYIALYEESLNTHKLEIFIKQLYSVIKGKCRTEGEAQFLYYSVLTEELNFMQNSYSTYCYFN
jgi:hypothetical protein